MQTIHGSSKEKSIFFISKTFKIEWKMRQNDCSFESKLNVYEKSDWSQNKMENVVNEK